MVSIEKKKIQIVDNIVFTELDDEICIFDSISTDYINLNETASEIWKMIDGNLKFEEIIDSLIIKYDIKKSDCIKEVNKFLSSFLEKGFLTIKQ
tara:strand:- start:412 stop:693 length:282 start_codon:yes stop_codon:yes gene_type:complete